jgi:hypothetical protein
LEARQDPERHFPAAAAMVLRPSPSSQKARRSQHASGRCARRPAGGRGARQFRPGTRSCSATPGSRTDRALLARPARPGCVTAGYLARDGGIGWPARGAEPRSSAPPYDVRGLPPAGWPKRRYVDKAVYRSSQIRRRGRATTAGRSGRGRLRAEHGDIPPAWWRRTRRITRRAGSRRSTANSGSGLGLV